MMENNRWKDGALNEVSIEGILSEVNLREGQDNDGNPAIIGEYKVKTENTYGDKTYPVEIQIPVYQSKITSHGKDNPAYVTAEKIMKDYVSIAAGGEEKATAIRLPERSTGLRENFFVSKTTGQMIHTTVVRASFANKIDRAEMDKKAKFRCVVVVGELTDELDKEGIETGRLILKGILPQYGGKVDLINFIVDNKKVADHIRNNWQKGDTVMIGGNINFTTLVKETSTESDDSFGEPIVSKTTTYVKEFVITGGHNTPLTPEEGAYDAQDIAEALLERKNRIKAKENIQPKKKEVPSFGF